MKNSGDKRILRMLAAMDDKLDRLLIAAGKAYGLTPEDREALKDATAGLKSSSESLDAAADAGAPPAESK